MKSTVFAASAVLASCQSAGTQTQEEHPRLSVSECSGSGSCTSQQKSVTIDSNWRWTHKTGATTNCYTGNEWDKTACPDPQTCAKNCVIDGAGKEYQNTYGVDASGSNLKLQFVTQGPYSRNVGSRLYLLDSDDTSYQMFHLANKEFTFDVDVSKMPCGLNGALYFVQMDKDGGKSKYNNAGAKYGTGYCDAQCPHDLKWINGVANVLDWKPSDTDVNAGTGKYGTCCTEIDLWEANSMSQAYTMHACSVDGQTQCSGVDCGDNPDHRFDGVCDKNGCDYATYRLGETNFYGPGSQFQVDTTQKFTVTTQFVTDDGTDDGEIVEVRRQYSQGGSVIKTPAVTLQGNSHDSITNDFCTDWVATTKDGTNFLEKGKMGSVHKSMKAGVVLVLSMWDDHEANMLWLDSTYPVDGTSPGDKRGTCSTSSGVPKDVESQHGDASVTYSNIKYGPIGSTVGPSPPSPSPSPSPSPTPSPSPSGQGKCCFAGAQSSTASCNSGNCLDGANFCAQSQSNCESNCAGMFCPATSVV